MRCYIAGIGLRAPGLPDWETARGVLTGAAPWTPDEVLAPPPAMLAANERRRAGLPVRLALAVAEEAVRMAGLNLAGVRAVFASGNGEGAILHDLLQALAAAPASGAPPPISPTQFHNSVHNAVAGYWAMGAGSMQPMTCLGAHDDTLAAALLKALAEVSVERVPVLCCVYDVPVPAPLRAKQPIDTPFAVALVLLPEPASGTLAGLDVRWRAGAPNTVAGPAWMETLRCGNPIAGVLPLLAAAASGRGAGVDLRLLDGTVAVQITPCSTAPRS
jgi:hypothetical protein